MRVLVTGSRHFTAQALVWQALEEQYATARGSGFVVVHGDCPTGADKLAKDWAAHCGYPEVTEEAHPAQWPLHGNAAGPLRNRFMAALGADLCLAFPHGNSPGTANCVTHARAAGIPVKEITMVDPFAYNDAPEEETPTSTVFDAPPPEAPNPPAATVVSPRAEAAGGEKVVMTLKGGAGFDAPWIVIHAADLQDAYEQVSGNGAVLLAKVMDNLHKASQHFLRLTPAATQPAGPAPQPPAYQQPPGGEQRFCSHGAMSFKSGVSKAGRAYQGYFCPSTDRAMQCKAQFV